MLITNKWLHNHLQADQLVIIDCRFALDDKEAGWHAYQVDHIPGAHYLHMERDLSQSVSAHGGRHPLPDPEILATRLGQLGIDQSTTVIAYDDQKGAMAARCWWLLTYLGHPDVHVLDGGYSTWKETGYPVSSVIPQAEPRTFIPTLRPDMLADQTEVLLKLSVSDTQLIDSRESVRYRGLEEPIDPVAGHIPGAVNYPWFEVLDDKQHWKSEQQLQEHFAELDPNQELIVYCGSGITATPNVMALQRAGFKRVKLYAGSWSDWITYPTAPTATDKD